MNGTASDIKNALPAKLIRGQRFLMATAHKGEDKFVQD
jgi:hypothetical protein